MCDEWMPPLQLRMSFDKFHRLPRNSAYKYEYFDKRAWLSPRPRFFHGLLDLTQVAPGGLDWPDRETEVRTLQAEDWVELPKLFAAAFRSRQPFGSLNDPERLAAADKCLARTRTGGDGPLIAEACYLAYHPQMERAVGAILITLLPANDPANADSYFWRQPPPEDWLQQRLGRPHLTWIFVSPVLAGKGVGTALLDVAGKALLRLGYRELASTFLLGNDVSMAWHWRNGFRLLTQPHSLRRPLD
jgi:GNAT superfamily N-acetyltransferase